MWVFMEWSRMSCICSTLSKNLRSMNKKILLLSITKCLIADESMFGLVEERKFWLIVFLFSSMPGNVVFMVERKYNTYGWLYLYIVELITRKFKNGSLRCMVFTKQAERCHSYISYKLAIIGCIVQKCLYKRCGGRFSLSPGDCNGMSLKELKKEFCLCCNEILHER